MDNDPELRRWSLILLLLAVVAVVSTAGGPLVLFLRDVPIALARGTEIWSTGFRTLSALDRAVVLAVLLAPQVAWVYAIAQVLRLARRYMRGLVFEASNTLCFQHMGGALVVMGLLQMAGLPILGPWLYHRGIAPWLPDLNPLALFDVDLLMSGIFFFVLGKIMRRGADLQDADRLTI